MAETEGRPVSRREWLASTGIAGALAAQVAPLRAQVGAPLNAQPDAQRSAAVKNAAPRQERQPFGYCFNTSTIQGQKLDLPTQIDLIADAGYTAVELWVRDIESFAQRGGSLEDLAKRIRDRGLVLPSAIAFFPWLNDDEAARTRGLEQAKREMDLVRRLGATRIAAPPVGERREAGLDLLQAAARYRAVADLGASMGVTPQLELWSFSRSISRIGAAAFVAMESGHPQACLLLDVFHIYKGGSDFHAMRLLSGEGMHVLHVNDYPASPSRAAIKDAARVFPGDGIAPLGLILRMLRDGGFHGYLSLEVFNRDYWKQDPHLVARTGLRKIKSVVEQSLG